METVNKRNIIRAVGEFLDQIDKGANFSDYYAHMKHEGFNWEMSDLKQYKEIDPPSSDLIIPSLENGDFYAAASLIAHSLTSNDFDYAVEFANDLVNGSDPLIDQKLAYYVMDSYKESLEPIPDNETIREKVEILKNDFREAGLSNKYILINDIDDALILSNALLDIQKYLKENNPQFSEKELVHESNNLLKDLQDKGCDDVDILNFGIEETMKMAEEVKENAIENIESFLEENHPDEDKNVLADTAKDLIQQLKDKGHTYKDIANGDADKLIGELAGKETIDRGEER